MIEFNASNHTYWSNGVKVSSVTQILNVLPKPALQAWKLRTVVDHFRDNLCPGIAYDEIQLKTLCDAASEAFTPKGSRAASIGTGLHAFVERYLQTGEEEKIYNQEMANSYESFIAWHKDHKPEVIATELVVFHPEEWYAGTIDLVCKIGGDIHIVDFKTSAAIYDEYFLQVIAYAEAWGANYTGTLESAEYNFVDDVKASVLRLPKNKGKYQFKTAERWDIDVFLAAKDVYEWVNRSKR